MRRALRTFRRLRLSMILATLGLFVTAALVHPLMAAGFLAGVFWGQVVAVTSRAFRRAAGLL